MKLAEIDQIAADGPLPVARLELEESGIDPIGMRQLNLDLMDAVIPGINNVVSHIRPYTFMAWTWKMATDVVGASGSVHSVEALDYVARLETYYEWAHSLAGRPFRGAAALRKALPHNNSTEPFPFRGERWEEFKRNRLGFMAPTEYGPSIKALGVLKPVEGGMFVPCRQFEKAIAVIDDAVKGAIPPRLLAREPCDVLWDEVLALAKFLPIDEPSDEERRAFKLLFYDAPESAPTAAKRRRATIDLVRSLMPKDGNVGIDDVRRSFASGHALGAEASKMVAEFGDLSAGSPSAPATTTGHRGDVAVARTGASRTRSRPHLGSLGQARRRAGEGSGRDRGQRTHRRCLSRWSRRFGLGSWMAGRRGSETDRCRHAHG